LKEDGIENDKEKPFGNLGGKNPQKFKLGDF
jgi:hypothetical protein